MKQKKHAGLIGKNAETSSTFAATQNRTQNHLERHCENVFGRGQALSVMSTSRRALPVEAVGIFNCHQCNLSEKRERTSIPCWFTARTWQALTYAAFAFSFFICIACLASECLVFQGKRCVEWWWQKISETGILKLRQTETISMARCHKYRTMEIVLKFVLFFSVF